jgi:hypothetical protein
MQWLHTSKLTTTQTVRSARSQISPTAINHSLPLLIARPGLALVPDNRMQLDLDWVVRRVATVPLAPVVTDCVGKDVARATETCGGDASTNLWVALEAVLCVLVPEMESPVAAGGAEGAVNGVEGDGVDGVDFGDVALVRVGLAVAFE